MKIVRIRYYFVAGASIALLLACSGAGTNGKVGASAELNANESGVSASLDLGAGGKAEPGAGWEDSADNLGADDGDVDGGTPSATMPIATLPGFRMLKNGRSRVFVEISGKISVTESSDPGIVRYVLKGVRVPERVNRMWLPTDHFLTPVKRARLVRISEGAELIIELRHQVVSKARLRNAPYGVILSVDFPKVQEVDRSNLTVTGIPRDQVLQKASPEKQ